ncbi:MAG: hypothetical protein AB7O88_17070 [Reyranellaceae bacterium]
MLQAFVEQVAAWSGTYQRLLTSHPVAVGLWLAVGVALTVQLGRVYRRGDMRAALGLVAVFVVALQLISFGDDIGHHVYRVAAIAGQLRAGAPSLLLADAATGTVLPTFVYYSPLLYLPSVLLDLLGVPAFVAVKVVAGAALLAMAAGVRALVDEHAARSDGRPDPAAYLVAVLFLTANYVFGLWIARAAFAEIWVYCLAPWVTLFLLRGNFAALVALLFVQLCAHPLVFAQALAAELLVAVVLVASQPRHLIRIGLPALLGAFLLSSPYWLPLLLWKDHILGSRALPTSFAQSFMSVGALFDPRLALSIGPFLPLAPLAMLALRRLGLPGRAWLGLACVVLLLAMQTRPLEPLVSLVPVLNESLFVWRLMLPTAFAAFGVLVVGWPAEAVWPRRALAAVSLLAVAPLLVTFVKALPGSFFGLEARANEEAVLMRSYGTDGLGWGVREFVPSYAHLPDVCHALRPDTQRAAAAELRRQVRATGPYLAVRWAPVGTVSYEADGAAVGLGACGDDLILGPLIPGARVQLSEARLERLLWLRLAVLLVVPLLLLGFRRSATARA